MIGERTAEGLVVRLTPRGNGRFFSAAFIAFWLCAWAVGEGIVLWFLVKGGLALMTGEPPDPGRAPLESGPALAVGGFLLLWLAFWTLGGLAAMGALVKLLWAEDRLVAQSHGLTVHWLRGPFRRTREIPRDLLRAIRVLPAKQCMTLETDREVITLSTLGTAAEREAAVQALRSELAIVVPEQDDCVLPKGWETVLTPEGERAIVADTGVRKVQSRVAAGAALFFSVVAFIVLCEALRQPAMIPFAALSAVAAAGLVWGTTWLAWGRMEFRVTPGVVSIRKRFRSDVRDVFDARQLELTVRSDSDGDDWFALDGVSNLTETKLHEPRGMGRSKDRRTIVSVMHDPTVPRRLGEWMARAAGIPFVDRSTREARAAETEALLEQLSQSGPFGRTAAKFVRRLTDEGERKA